MPPVLRAQPQVRPAAKPVSRPAPTPMARIQNQIQQAQQARQARVQQARQVMPFTKPVNQPMPVLKPAPQPVMQPAPAPQPVMQPAPAPQPVMQPAPNDMLGGMTPGQALGGELTRPLVNQYTGTQNAETQPLPGGAFMGLPVEMPMPQATQGFYGSSNPFSMDVVFNETPLSPDQYYNSMMPGQTGFNPADLYNRYQSIVNPAGNTAMTVPGPLNQTIAQQSQQTTPGQTLNQGWNGTGIGFAV